MSDVNDRVGDAAVEEYSMVVVAVMVASLGSERLFSTSEMARRGQCALRKPKKRAITPRLISR